MSKNLSKQYPPKATGWVFCCYKVVPYQSAVNMYNKQRTYYQKPNNGIHLTVPSALFPNNIVFSEPIAARLAPHSDHQSLLSL